MEDPICILEPSVAVEQRMGVRGFCHSLVKGLKNQCVIVRRDTREKIVVSLDEVNEKLAEVLETMQNDMLEKAKAFLASHINDAHDYNEFKAIAETKPGFIRAMWCGDEACENKIKEDTTVTSRCMPFGDQEQISDVCVCCGKPAHKLVYWGKAY